MEGLDFGSWKREVLRPGRVRFWGLEGLGFRSWKGIVGPGRGFWVLEGDCGSWKGHVLRHGRGGFWVLKGSGFRAWKDQVLGPGRVRLWGWCPSAHS